MLPLYAFQYQSIYLPHTSQKSIFFGPNKIGLGWYESYNMDPIPGPRCYENFQNTQYQDENFNIVEERMNECRYRDACGWLVVSNIVNH